MKTSTRERRDWTLLIFIIPVGIILMLIAGQIAIHLAPLWSIPADMRSKLDPSDTSKTIGLMQPIGMGILTPYVLNLTPGTIEFPPIIVLEPDGTVTVVASEEPTAFPTVTQVLATPTSTKFNTAVPTATKGPTSTEVRYVTFTRTPTPTRTGTPTRTATSNVTATRTPTRTLTRTPTSTSNYTATHTPTATSNYTATYTPTSTSDFTPTFTPTLTPDVTATPTNSPTVTPTDVTYPSTPDGNLVPSDIEIGVPPDEGIQSIPPGTYTVINISASPIVVGNDTSFYELVYYESRYLDNDYILLDAVILGISNSDTLGYYQVFNWGDGNQDLNTNIPSYVVDVKDIVNQDILLADLWPNPGTGIAIDADGAPSAPPPGEYKYLWVICPSIDPPLEALEVDSIEIFP